MFAGSGRLSLINGAGHAVVNGDAVTVQGGAGSIAILGSVGELRGGTAGGNVIQAGTGGVSTLYGAGADDVLVTSGSVSNRLFAGAGNETLDGSASSGDNVFVGGTGPVLVRAGAGRDIVLAGNSTRLTLDAQGPGDKMVVLGGGDADLTLGSGGALVQAGSGAATITGGAGPDEYRFINGSAGGHETIANFKVGVDQLAFVGYGDEPAELRGIEGGSVLTLSDNTSITLLGVTDLPRTAFV